MSGVDFSALSLLPDVRYPVRSGTPMLSPLVAWDHSQAWDVPTLDQFTAGTAGGKTSCIYKV